MPGVSQETSWTLTNVSYMAGSYLMFHYVRGVPFDFNSGAFDNLNMWEQIDNGDQYTPAKKFLMFVPIALFLVSTHYTHYDLTYFVINTLATIAVVIPKLPSVSLLELLAGLQRLIMCRPIGYVSTYFPVHQTTTTHRKNVDCIIGSDRWILRVLLYVFLICSVAGREVVLH